VLTTGAKAARQSEAVVFYSSPAAIVKRPPRFTIPAVGPLPSRPTIRIEDLAPALREAAARGGGRTARVGPPARTAPLSPRRLASASVSSTIEHHRQALADRFDSRLQRVEATRRQIVQRPLDRAGASAAANSIRSGKEDFA
jgi:hypothetical protein